MDKKYYLTDLDGTLLNSDATLSRFTVEVISEALNKGDIISYATARSYISSNHVVSDISWKHPLVLYNGALLFDPVNKLVLDGYWLNQKITNDIIEIGRANGLLPLLFMLDSDDQERVLHEKLTRYGDLHFYNSRPDDPRFVEITRLHCPDSSRTLIITYIGLFEELEILRIKIIELYGDHVHIHLMKDLYITNNYFLEISHNLANKQEGLALWAKLVGCEPKDVTVFGDNINDIGMFLTAGKKVAVANARQEILDMADQIIASNNEDSVAKYIVNAVKIR